LDRERGGGGHVGGVRRETNPEKNVPPEEKQTNNQPRVYEKRLLEKMPQGCAQNFDKHQCLWGVIARRKKKKSNRTREWSRAQPHRPDVEGGTCMISSTSQGQGGARKNFGGLYALLGQDWGRQ